jgi:hypothetical protein
LLQLDWRRPSKDLNEHPDSAVACIHRVNDANEVLEDAVVDAHAVSLFETIWLRLGFHRPIIGRRRQPEQGISGRPELKLAGAEARIKANREIE